MSRKAALRIFLAMVVFTAGAALSQTPSGAISGRVIGLDGKPAAGIRVAVAAPEANGQISTDTLAAIAKTDAAGRYRLEDIPPGRYGIVAGAVARPTYFPGTAAAADARIISLGDGDQIDGLDFPLVNAATQPQMLSLNLSAAIAAFAGIVIGGNAPPIASVRVSARIVMENGMPPPDLSQSYRLMSITSQPLANGIAPLPDGTFLITLNEGVYPISFSGLNGRPPDDYYVKSIAFGSVDLLKDKLTVKANSTDEIVVTIGVAAAIPGKVVDAGGQPVSGLQVYLWPTKSPGMMVPSGTTDDSGNFTIRGAGAGEYRISGRDTTGIGPTVSVGSSQTAPLNLILTALPGVRTLTLAGPDSSK